MKSLFQLALIAAASSRYLISEVWIPATNEGPITDCSGVPTILAATSEQLGGVDFNFSLCDNIPNTGCTALGDWFVARHGNWADLTSDLQEPSKVYCADTIPEGTGSGYRSESWMGSTTECNGPPTVVSSFSKTGCFPLIPSDVGNLTQFMAGTSLYLKVSCESTGTCQDQHCLDCLTVPVFNTDCVGAGGSYSTLTCGTGTQTFSIELDLSAGMTVSAAELEQYLQQGLEDWGVFGSVSVSENNDGSFTVTISNTNADEASVQRAAESTPGVSRATVTSVGAGASALSLFF